MNCWLLVDVAYVAGRGLVFRWYNWGGLMALFCDTERVFRGFVSACHSLHRSLDRFKGAIGDEPLDDDLDWWEGW